MLSYANGVLTLSGTARAATQQSTLDPDTTRFRSDPTKGGSEPTRTLSWQVHDANTIAGENTAGDTSTINVTHAPPSIGGAGNTVTYIEKQPPIVLDGGLTVSDTDTITGTTVTITG